MASQVSRFGAINLFLLGLKDRVYKTKPQNLDELRQTIIDESALIPTVMIKNAVNAFYHRLAYCQKVNGG